MVMSDSEGRAALAEVVGAELVPRSELDDRLTAAGHRVTDEQLRRIIQFDTRFYEVGDDVGFLPGLTDGVAFSVWVDPATADEDFLVVKPALEVLIWWIVQGQVDLFDEAGDRLGEVETDGWMIDGVDTDVLLGPDGWLDPYADSWVAFRVREGTLVIERLTGPPPVDAARAAAVRSAFQAVAKHQEFRRFGDDEAIDVPRSGVQEVLKQAIGCDNSLFVGEPLPPMSELFGAAGLRIERPWVVPADLDADLYAEAEAMRLAMARWGPTPGRSGRSTSCSAQLSCIGRGTRSALGRRPRSGRRRRRCLRRWCSARRSPGCSATSFPMPNCAKPSLGLPRASARSSRAIRGPGECAGWRPIATSSSARSMPPQRSWTSCPVRSTVFQCYSTVSESPLSAARPKRPFDCWRWQRNRSMTCPRSP